MIIVCDTNVLISALIFPGGIPDKIVRSFFSGRFQNATSPDILTELRRNLQRILDVDKKQTESLVSLIVQSSHLVYPTERLTVVKDDDTDNRIIECAVTAKAEFIITGDKKHLLPIKVYEGIAILSPREFATKLGVI